MTRLCIQGARKLNQELKDNRVIILIDAFGLASLSASWAAYCQRLKLLSNLSQHYWRSWLYNYMRGQGLQASDKFLDCTGRDAVELSQLGLRSIQVLVPSWGGRSSRWLCLPSVMRLHISWYCCISSHWLFRMPWFVTVIRNEAARRIV